MKKLTLATLTLTLAVLFSTHVEAARFTEQTDPSNRVFQELWNTVESFADVEYSQRGRETRSYNVFMKRGERLVNVIKQNVYERRAEQGVYSTPERVEVEYLSFDKQELDIEIFWHMLMRDYVTGEDEFYEEQMAAIRGFLTDSRARQDFALFRVADYNAYGECDGIAFFDRKDFELSFLGTCYAE